MCKGEAKGVCFINLLCSKCCVRRFFTFIGVIFSLYKWGGTYLDLDVIVKESFDKIQPNYAGAESENFVAAGLINFDYTNAGHEMAEQCLRYLFKVYLQTS